MKLIITDPIAEALGLFVEEAESDYILVRTDENLKGKNAFGFAHGGFLYTMGHITARNMAKMCLDRDMQVVQADNLYLKKLFGAPIRARGTLLSDLGKTIVCRVEILNAGDEVCFLQTLTLQNTGKDRAVCYEPKDPPSMDETHAGMAAFTGNKGDYLFFDEGVCHVTAPELHGDTVICSTDLYIDSVSDAGYVHQGALYTCADKCAAGCVALMQKRSPVTISGTINYLAPATIGPVTAEGRLIRAAKDFGYYQIDMFDGYGKPVVTTQFIMQYQPFPSHYQQ